MSNKEPRLKIHLTKRQVELIHDALVTLRESDKVVDDVKLLSDTEWVFSVLVNVGTETYEKF